MIFIILTKSNKFVILNTIFAGALSGRVLMHLIGWNAQIRAGFRNVDTIRIKSKDTRYGRFTDFKENKGRT